MAQLPTPSGQQTGSLRAIPLRMIIPNGITLLSLCSGLTGVRLAFEARFDLAVIAIAIAAVLDGLDGRVARLMKGSSRFGAELDSLADFICFGCAPALILYAWTLHELKNLGWIASLVLAIAAALRLARFNVMLDDPDKPDWQKQFFTGIPAPAGALCAIMPLNLTLAGVPQWPGLAYGVSLYIVAVAMLMVSRVPTFAGKRIGMRIPGQYVLFVLVGVVLLAALLVSHTFHTLAGLAIAYLIGLPFGLRHYRRLAVAHRMAVAEVPVEPIVS
jgi:CDP-diacylglycerol---serine O-phosphatidyltransferase